MFRSHAVASGTNVSNTANVALSTVSENYAIAFANACAEGETVAYAIHHTTVNEYEKGIGVYAVATGLTRSYVTETWNGSSLVRFGAKLAFTAGTVRVVVYPHAAIPDSTILPGLVSNATSDANAKNYATSGHSTSAMSTAIITANRLYVSPYLKRTSRPFTGALAIYAAASIVGANCRWALAVMNPDGSVGGDLITTGSNQITVSAGTGWKETSVICSGSLDIPPGWYYSRFIDDTADNIGLLADLVRGSGVAAGAATSGWTGLIKALTGWTGTPGVPAQPADMTIAATTAMPVIAPIFS